MEKGSIYQCLKCGNKVALLHAGGQPLACCGETMNVPVANFVGASKEKHIPVGVLSENSLDVTVGSVLHPMLDDHFIEWIAFVSEDRIEFVYLKPGDEPRAHFSLSSHFENGDHIIQVSGSDEIVPNCEGSPCNFSYSEESKGKQVIYSYCNLHGLWEVVL